MKELITLISLLLILWIKYCFSAKVVSDEKICDSIEVINNDLEKLNELKDCEIIEGSITLAKISLQNISEYSFPVREITGYLLVYRIEYLQSLGSILPNLTIIRGEEKFLQYSLMIYENINLLNLGMENLMSVSNGSIRITRNPQLCYVRTINWMEILTDMNEQNYVLKENRDENHCAICRELSEDEIMKVHNENFCWKYNSFQKVCNKFEGNKLASNPKNCCLNNCFSDCTLDLGKNSTLCSVCKKFKDSKGKCISDCEPNLFEWHNRKCITDDECKSLGLIPFNRKCIQKCPEGYMQYNSDSTCIECISSICPKLCKGNITIYNEADILPLKGCTKIDGYLEIELKSRNSKIIPLLESHLSYVEEITGYLKIAKSPQLTTLNFLGSLITVFGDFLIDKKYSLYVYDNSNLETLWRKHQKIIFLNGTSFFHLNPRFCINEISNLRFKNDLDNHLNIDDIEGPFQISNGYETYCNKTTFNTNVEEVNAIAARIMIEPFLSRIYKTSCLGYIYYYMEAPEKNISVFDSFNGCGYDNWKIGISLGLNIRYVIKNLKPNTQYAYFVRTLSINDYHLKVNAISNINYFKTKTIDDRPPPITKLYFNVINSTAIELFWRSPTLQNDESISSVTDEISRSYYISLNYTSILHNLHFNENLTKFGTTVITKNYNNNFSSICYSPSSSETSYKWRGLYPKENDYYRREQFLLEELLPNHLYPHDDSSTASDIESQNVFPPTIKFDKNKLNNFNAYLRKLDEIFHLEQDTGIDNFKLPEINENLSKNSETIIENEECCTKTCICLNGIRTNYMIRDLRPSMWYKIIVKVCNKNNICSIATNVNVRTMRNIADDIHFDDRYNRNPSLA